MFTQRIRFLRILVTDLKSLMLNIPVGVRIEDTNFQFLREETSHDQHFSLFSNFIYIKAKISVVSLVLFKEL
jgi:hypothetical protein